MVPKNVGASWLKSSMRSGRQTPTEARRSARVLLHRIGFWANRSCPTVTLYSPVVLAARRGSPIVVLYGELGSQGDSRHEYIYEACRIAVAHAGKDSKSDPDNANELVRLHTAANVLRIFARHFIASEFGVSESVYSGD
jgi:hypothetical protein